MHAMILRHKSSNGCHCGFTTFLPACRFMMCGPSIYRGRAPASRWMNSCGWQARVRSHTPLVRALLNIPLVDNAEHGSQRGERRFVSLVAAIVTGRANSRWG
jgi:hypothetical protein